MATIDRMLQIIVQEFSGVVDKSGAPYLLHLIEVGMAGETDEEKMVGFGHDLKEDRGWQDDDFRREGFSERVISGIASVSRLEGEPYMDFIRRAHKDPLGRPVKRRDLKHNMKIDRIHNITERDLSRQKRYERAWALMDQLDAEAQAESAQQPRTAKPR